MGACDFLTVGKGPTARAAFTVAKEEALCASGHGGYSGTIAEKGSYQMIDLPEGKTAFDYAEELMNNDDPRISDRWGPAGCIKIKEGSYLFFGYASS